MSIIGATPIAPLVLMTGHLMTRQATLMLGATDVARTVTLPDYIEAAEQAFAALGTGRMQVARVAHVPAPNGGFHVKSAGFIGDPGYVAVKVNGNFPGNPQAHGLPTIQGAIVLCDGRDGRLLAVMDSIEVTTMRTAAATAVAAKHLAHPRSAAVTVIGCGVQGRAQALALMAVLPVQTLYACDPDRRKRDAFVERLAAEAGCAVHPVDRFMDGTLASQVIVTCTPAREPFLRREHVAPGTFIAAIGADSTEKQELDVGLLASARVVVDLVTQCAEIGELHHAIEAGAMTQDDVYGELADIVSGTKRPAFGPDDIVVFDSTGCAVQDVAAAGMIYERARAAAIGTEVHFC